MREAAARLKVGETAFYMASLNKRHVAFFNLHRLRALEPIGLMLYKRFFYVTGRSEPHRWFAGELRLVTYGVLLLGLQ